MRLRLLVTQPGNNDTWEVYDQMLHSALAQNLPSQAEAVQVALDNAIRHDGRLVAVLPIGDQIGIVCELR